MSRLSKRSDAHYEAKSKRIKTPGKRFEHHLPALIHSLTSIFFQKLRKAEQPCASLLELHLGTGGALERIASFSSEFTAINLQDLSERTGANSRRADSGGVRRGDGRRKQALIKEGGNSSMLKFLGRRLFEFFFLALWVLLVWLLHAQVFQRFPITGLPKVMVYVFEIVFAVATLIELYILLFMPPKE